MVAIVTDSTCDLPAATIQQHQLEIVPQYIVWGDESLRDGIDIDTTTFYRRLATSTTLPHTSRPTPTDMINAWEAARVQQNADEVLCITATSKASGTYPSAMEALPQVDFPVRVIDSRLISMGMGFLVLRAVELRDAGLGLDEIAAQVERYIPQIDVFFTVATLDFLHRGGRIGKARHMVGSALQIKPLLHLDDGQVTAYGSVRTRGKALNRLLELADQHLANCSVRRVAVIHGEAPEEAARLSHEVKERLQPDQFFQSSICAAIGVHAGPGVIGLALDANNN